MFWIIHAWYLTKISSKEIDRSPILCFAPSNAVEMQNPRKSRDHMDAHLEHGDVVADPVFLVLRNALGDPGDVADFLNEPVSVVAIAQHAECKIFDIPALSALATRTQWRV